MDRIEKHRRLCAIYLAISCRNYRCAEMVFDDSVTEELNEFLLQIHELAFKNGQMHFVDEIHALIQKNLKPFNFN